MSGAHWQSTGERPRETGAPMAVSSAEVRAIGERACARPDALDACSRRDLGAVIAALEAPSGLTQGRISGPDRRSARPTERVDGRASASPVRCQATFQAFRRYGLGFPVSGETRAGAWQPTRSPARRGRANDSRHLELSGRGGAGRGDGIRTVACGPADVSAVPRGRSILALGVRFRLRWLLDPWPRTGCSSPRTVCASAWAT